MNTGLPLPSPALSFGGKRITTTEVMVTLHFTVGIEAETCTIFRSVLDWNEYGNLSLSFRDARIKLQN